MQSGEIIIVRLNNRPGIGRLVEHDSTRVRVTIGRTREARLPLSRVLLETGIHCSGYEEVESLTRDAEAIASRVDLSELWDIVCEEKEAFVLEDLAELYWGNRPTSTQQVGLLFHLARNNLQFITNGKQYLPRSREELNELVIRRDRADKHTNEARILAEYLSSKNIPQELTPHQTHLMKQLRGLAVFGEEYTGVTSAKKYLTSIVGKTADYQRAAFQILVRVGYLSNDEFLALEASNIPDGFSSTILEEAQSIDISKEFDDPNRRDLTSLNVITVDDPETQDRDDGLSIEYVATEINGIVTKAYKVGVHVADASACVQPWTSLDEEAGRRMATLYLPERNIWMLPPEISSNVGSLSPGEVRLAISLIATFTPDGVLLDSEVVPSIIKSVSALSYEAVDDRLNDQNSLLHQELSAMSALAKKLRETRQSSGIPNLDRDELSIKISDSKEISVGVIKRSNPARSMVAEYMIFYNSMMAEFCKEHELPAPYRSQEAPDTSDIATQIPEGPLRWYLTVRRMSPATISTEPSAHAGLGVPSYIQASSPLRRYPDLVAQRQISNFLRAGGPFYSKREIESIAQRADMQIREHSKLELERQKYWFLKYLDDERRKLDRMGEESIHEACVLENPPNRAGIMDLVDYPFRVRAALGSTIQPGAIVRLRLHNVDLWRRVGQFVVAPSTQR